MTRREFDRFARVHLVPNLPGFAATKGLIVRMPVDDLLAGFSFDPSAFSRTAFTVRAFVQPLYVPNDDVTLSFGDDLGAWDFEDRETSEVAREVLERVLDRGILLVDRIRTPLDMAHNAPVLWYRDEPATREVVAASLAAAGRLEAAREELVALAEREEESPNPYRPDVSAERAQRARRLIRAIDAGGKAPREVLDDWRAYTLAHLNLTVVAD